MNMRTLLLFIADPGDPRARRSPKRPDRPVWKKPHSEQAASGVLKRSSNASMACSRSWPGYAGGHTVNPTYDQVCTGTTGHAEVAQITFDPTKISYAKLLEIFWDAHDPTTLNRQGADAGTQYRSVIFVHSPQQRATAEASRTAAQKQFDDPIVTEIQDLDTFYPAENYHQDYFRRTSGCAVLQIRHQTQTQETPSGLNDGRPEEGAYLMKLILPPDALRSGSVTVHHRLQHRPDHRPQTIESHSCGRDARHELSGVWRFPEGEQAEYQPAADRHGQERRGEDPARRRSLLAAERICPMR